MPLPDYSRCKFITCATLPVISWNLTAPLCETYRQRRQLQDNVDDHRLARPRKYCSGGVLSTSRKSPPSLIEFPEQLRIFSVSQQIACEFLHSKERQIYMAANRVSGQHQRIVEYTTVLFVCVCVVYGVRLAGKHIICIIVKLNMSFEYRCSTKIVVAATVSYHINFCTW